MLTGTTLVSTTTAATAAVTDNDPSFEVTEADLRFILKQIKISESHATDGNLLCESETDSSGTCVPHPLLPWGLRTVDGSYNNLMPGQEKWGAGDQGFPRIFDEYNRAGETPPPGAPPAGSTEVCGTDGATCYAQNGPGHFVYDSDPRTISNLIVDQTVDNPAAVEAAASVPGAQTYDHDNNPDTPNRVFIPNEAPDEGLSAPFNSWMTLFGQFFDHGLDLVDKGGNGTVVIPLQPDDDLYNANSRTNFMMVTRATVVGTNEKGRVHKNKTTPFVDQNQTYTSHPSHHVFLREYVATASGPESSGHLLDGGQGGLASWAEIKTAAAEKLGIQLTDRDVVNVPQVLVDWYGQFIPGPGGHPQVVFPDGEDADGDPDLVEGDPTAPVSTDGALRTGHAFLDDIAHNAAPGTWDHDSDPRTPQVPKTPDGDAESNDPKTPRPAGTYDDEFLGAHFITGDGRGNENIGLSAVHHVFHAEHNRLADSMHQIIQNNPKLKAGYEGAEGAGMPGRWTYGDRLFQAARFVTEMEYQHLVFEEFARTVQPSIDPAPFNESTYHSTTNADIPAEFAHVVYRFGHSMLTDSIDRRGFGAQNLSLFDGFLNPHAFTDNGTLTPDQGAAAIINGMVAQTGNGIDEFVDDTLRNQLLGLPLDLPAINLARGRDTGVPPLQEVRRYLYEQTADSALKPYENWTDFGNGLKHPASLVNFVAAYGTHETITAASTVAGKRAAAQALVDAGDPFLDAPAAESGLDEVDFWMGGLAEEGMPFGGMLGSTFNYVFEHALEDLQNGDRFYYLNRNIGLNLFHQLEANSFSALVQRTTAASEVPTNIFASQDGTVYDLEVEVANEAAGGALSPGLSKMANGTYRYNGEEHIQMHGQRTAADRMRADIGDDALWGYGGEDRIEGGAGNDQFVGGAGDDILTDLFGDDNIKGSKGNDAIHAGPGLDLIHGGAGRDFILHGQDDTQTFAGQGDDFLLGGPAHDIFAGNEGDDWLESMAGSDLLQGDNSNGFQDDPYGGNDILLSGPGNDDYDSEGGDDIMVTDPGTDRHEGMLGFDWVTHKNDPTPGKADMDNTVFQPPSVQNMRDRYDLVEALSGWNNDDVLRGVGHVDVPPGMLDPEVCADFGRPTELATDEDGRVTACTGHELTEAHLDMVAGLEELLRPTGGGDYTGPFMEDNTTNDIIIGGGGSDLIEGRAGDDFIDGSAWLDVKLQYGGQSYDSMRQLMNGVFADPQTVNHEDITLVREIVVPAEDGVNTAVFSDVKANYKVLDNGDGTFTVRHIDTTRPPEDNPGEPEDRIGGDGEDIIRNIDRLLFADGDVAVTDMVDRNNAASGSITLSTMDPMEGQQMSITAHDLNDPDGINEETLVFTWEVGEDVEGFVPAGEGLTYTPTHDNVGDLLRVVATFTDDQGVIEQVVSEPTNPVAADPNLVDTLPDPPDQEDGAPAPGGDTGGTPPGGNTGGTPPGGNTGGTPPGGNTGGTPPGGNTGGTPPGGNTGGTPPGGNTGGDTGGTPPGGNTGGDTGGTPPGGNTGGGTNTLTIASSTPSVSALNASRVADVTMTLESGVQGVNARTVTLLRPNGKRIPAAVRFDAATQQIVLDPRRALPAGKRVRVVLDGLRNEEGDLLPRKVWRFTTVDDVKPRVVKVRPVAKGSVGRNANVRLWLSERVRGANAKAVVLREVGGKRVAAKVRYNAKRKVVRINPKRRLARHTRYVVVVRPRVQDTSDNRMQRTVWRFRTR